MLFTPLLLNLGPSLFVMHFFFVPWTDIFSRPQLVSSMIK